MDCEDNEHDIDCAQDVDEIIVRTTKTVWTTSIVQTEKFAQSSLTVCSKWTAWLPNGRHSFRGPRQLEIRCKYFEQLGNVYANRNYDNNFEDLASWEDNADRMKTLPMRPVSHKKYAAKIITLLVRHVACSAVELLVNAPKSQKI